MDIIVRCELVRVLFLAWSKSLIHLINQLMRKMKWTSLCELLRVLFLGFSKAWNMLSAYDIVVCLERMRACMSSSVPLCQVWLRGPVHVLYIQMNREVWVNCEAGQVDFFAKVSDGLGCCGC